MTMPDELVKYFARRGYEHAHSHARRIYRETNGDIMAVHAVIDLDKDRRLVASQINAVASVLHANDPRFDEDPDRYIPISREYARAQEEGRI